MTAPSRNDEGPEPRSAKVPKQDPETDERPLPVRGREKTGEGLDLTVERISTEGLLKEGFAGQEM